MGIAEKVEKLKELGINTGKDYNVRIRNLLKNCKVR